jgi:hypothetical protein
MQKLVLAAVLIAVALVSAAEARMKTVGRGDRITFDPESIPASYRAAFAILSKKCVQCHTMERTVIAIQTGKAPITGQPFDKQAVKAYGIKMLRKPNSGMDKQEIRDVVMLLNFMLDENAK